MKTCTDPQSYIEALKSDFAAFRASGHSRAKVPENLRHAVIDAVDAGVEVTQLRTALGVSRSQIAAWRGCKPQIDTQPRVLDLIEEAPGGATPTGLRVSYEKGRLLLEFSF